MLGSSAAEVGPFVISSFAARVEERLTKKQLPEEEVINLPPSLCVLLPYGSIRESSPSMLLSPL